MVVQTSPLNCLFTYMLAHIYIVDSRRHISSIYMYFLAAHECHARALLQRAPLGKGTTQYIETEMFAWRGEAMRDRQG